MLVTDEPFVTDMEDILIEDTPIEGGSPPAIEPKKPSKAEEPKKDNFGEELIEIPDIETEGDEGKGKDSNQPPKSTEQTSSSSPSVWVSFAKSLEGAGLLNEFTEEEFATLAEEVGSPVEAVIALAESKIDGIIREHINSQDDDYKEFVKMRDSGVDLTEYAKIAQQAKEYSSYKIEDVRTNPDLQKKVVREDMKIKGMANDEIDDLIESLEDTDKLGKRAEASVANLNKFRDTKVKELETQTKAQQKAEQEAYQNQLQSIRDNIETIKEVVPGIAINKQTKEKLYKMITEPAATTKDGRQVNAITAKMLQDPNKFNLITAELIRLGIYDGKWDSLVKITKSKAIEELEKVVNSGADFKSGSGGRSSSQTEYLKKMNF